jgi:hypothetical protein
VRGAAVAVTDTDTGVTRNTVTNDAGDYQVLDLTEGPYKVEVKASGFTREAQPTHASRPPASACERLLKVGPSQGVSVRADGAGAINTEAASIDAEICPPITRANQNGISPLNLIQTLPEVQADTGSNRGTGVQFFRTGRPALAGGYDH